MKNILLTLVATLSLTLASCTAGDPVPVAKDLSTDGSAGAPSALVVTLCDPLACCAVVPVTSLTCPAGTEGSSGASGSGGSAGSSGASGAGGVSGSAGSAGKAGGSGGVSGASAGGSGLSGRSGSAL